MDWYLSTSAHTVVILVKGGREERERERKELKLYEGRWST